MALADDGSRIVLAAGDYDEAIKLTSAIEVRGRCASLVSLRGAQKTPYGSDAVVWFEGADGAVVRDVTLGPSPAAGVMLHSGHVTLEGVQIAAATKYGVIAGGSGSDITLLRTVIAGTLAQSGSLGRAVDVEQGAAAHLVQSALFENRDISVAVLEDSSVSLEDSVVLGTFPEDETQSFGFGLFAQGGTLTVTDSAIVGNRSAGVRALKAATLVLDRSLVTGTLPRASSGDFGHGVEVSDGASAAITSSAIIGNVRVGVAIVGAGTQASLDGSYVADTLPRPGDNQLGVGVGVELGPVVTMTNMVLANNHDVGLFVQGSRVDVSSTLIEGTLPQVSDGLFGRGVDAEASQLTLTGSVVRSSHDVGVFALGAGTTVVADSLVLSTLPKQADGENGAGAVCADGAQLTMMRTLVSDSSVSAVRVVAATALIQASILRRVPDGAFSLQNPPQRYDGVGDGVLGMLGATVDVEDTLIEGCLRAGILFSSSGGTVSRTLSRTNAFGLVVQGSPAPIVDATSSFSGNTEGTAVTDADLPVPDAASAVPTWP